MIWTVLLALLLFLLFTYLLLRRIFLPWLCRRVHFSWSNVQWGSIEKFLLIVWDNQLLSNATSSWNPNTDDMFYSWSCAAKEIQHAAVLLESAKFAFAVEKLNWKLSIWPWSLDIQSVGHCNFFLSINMNHDVDKAVNANSKEQVLHENSKMEISHDQRHAKIPFLDSILHFIKSVRVSMQELCVLITQRSRPDANAFVLLQTELNHISLSSLTCSIEETLMQEVHLCQDHQLEWNVMHRQNVLVLPEITLKMPKMKDSSVSICVDLTINGVLQLDIWASLFCFLNSMRSPTISPNKVNLNRSSPSLPMQNLMTGSMQYVTGTIEIPGIEFRTHLPKERENSEKERFESILIRIGASRMHWRWDRRSPLPIFAMLIGNVEISSLGSSSLGSSVQSPATRFLSLNKQWYPNPCNLSETLLVGENLRLTNCWNHHSIPPTALDDSLVHKWIRMVVQGQAAWASLDPKGESVIDESFESFMNSERPVCSSWPFANGSSELGKVNPFRKESCSYSLLQEQNTVVVIAEEISFDVPFEYPLSNLIEHLQHFIKVPSSVRGMRQLQNEEIAPLVDGLAKPVLFSTIPWRLIVHSDSARFSVGDDPFEMHLSRCLRHQLKMKEELDRLERHFWSRLAQVRSPSAKLMPSDDPFLMASSYPNLLVDEHAISAYRQLHEAMFGLIRSKWPWSNADIDPLFQVYGSEVQFVAQWNPTYVYPMAVLNDSDSSLDSDTQSNDDQQWGLTSLFNAIDGQAAFEEQDVSNMDMILGAYLDLRAFDLVVQIRDYAVPLAALHDIHGSGLVFLLDQMPYDSALARLSIPIFAADDDLDWLLKWSIFGLPEDGMLESRHSIMPIKIYHSIHLRVPRKIPVASFSSTQSLVNPPALNPSIRSGQWRSTSRFSQSSLSLSSASLSNSLTNEQRSTSIQLNEEPRQFENVLGGFAMPFEGAFQMMDRSFDLFAKPSEEKSPVLPFWDKIRLLFHGNCSSALIQTPMRYCFLAGRNPWSLDDCLIAEIQGGTRFHMDSMEMSMLIPSAIISISSSSSKRLSLFHWLHTQQKCSADQVRKQSEFVSVIELPRVLCRMKTKLFGHGGRQLVSHSEIRYVAVGNPMVFKHEPTASTNSPTDSQSSPSSVGALGTQSPLSGRFDSYAGFRTRAMTLAFEIESVGLTADQLIWRHYRELEQWLVHCFSGFVDPPVKRGSLFACGVLDYAVDSAKISSVLTDIQLDVRFEGVFGVQMKQYYDVDDQGGVVLQAVGKTSLSLKWHKIMTTLVGSRNAQQMATTMMMENDNSMNVSWILHFAKVDLGTSQVGVIALRQLEEELEIDDDDPLFMDTVMGDVVDGNWKLLSLLSAPRLSYIHVDLASSCVDFEAAVVQQQAVDWALDLVQQQMDVATGKLQQCDPGDEDGYVEYSMCKSVLEDLMQQEEFLQKCKTSISFYCNFEESSSASSIGSGKASNSGAGDFDAPSVDPRHDFIVLSHPRLIWHQALRNAVYRLVNQQVHFHRQEKCLIYAKTTKGFATGQYSKQEENLAAMRHVRKQSANSQGHSRQSSVDRSGVSSPTTEAFFANLVSSGLDPIDATFEDMMSSSSSSTAADGEAGRKGNSLEDLSPNDLALAFLKVSKFVDLFSLLRIKLLRPELLLLDRNDGALGSLIVSATEALVQYGTFVSNTNNDDDDDLHCQSKKISSDAKVDVVSVGGMGKRRTRKTSRMDEEEDALGVRWKISLEGAIISTVTDGVDVLSKGGHSSQLDLDGSVCGISRRIDMSIVIDVGVSDLQMDASKDLKEMVSAVFSSGRRIRIRSHGPIALMMDATDYAVFVAVISRLLVYRDQVEALVSEQLDSLMLITSITDAEKMYVVVQSMREHLIDRLSSLQRKLKAAAADLDQSIDCTSGVGLSREKERNLLVLPERLVTMANSTMRVTSSSNGAETTAVLDSKTLLEEYSRIRGQWDELALVLDALGASHAASERVSGRNERIVVDVIVPKIKWTLKQTSGPICDLMLDNVHDRLLMAEDASECNVLEIGALRGRNRMKNAYYTMLIAPLSSSVDPAMDSGLGSPLSPSDKTSLPLDFEDGSLSIKASGAQGALQPQQQQKKVMGELNWLKMDGSLRETVGTQGNTIRMYHKKLAAVGGIRILEQVELNLAPLNVQLTHEIAVQLKRFFLDPIESKAKGMLISDIDLIIVNRTASASNRLVLEENSLSRSQSAQMQLSKLPLSDGGGLSRAQSLQSLKAADSFISRVQRQEEQVMQLDDGRLSMIQQMKQRSEQNYSFVYVHVPRTWHMISLHGSVLDLDHFVLKLPSIEYHSKLWTWSELFGQLLSDSKGEIMNNVGSLVKDKIIRKSTGNTPLMASLDSVADDASEEKNRREDSKKAQLLFGKSYTMRR